MPYYLELPRPFQPADNNRHGIFQQKTASGVSWRQDASRVFPTCYILLLALRVASVVFAGLLNAFLESFPGAKNIYTHLTFTDKMSQRQPI